MSMQQQNPMFLLDLLKRYLVTCSMLSHEQCLHLRPICSSQPHFPVTMVKHLLLVGSYFDFLISFFPLIFLEALQVLSYYLLKLEHAQFQS